MENFNFKKYLSESKLLKEDASYNMKYGAKNETLREIDDVIQEMSENYTGDDFNPEAARMLAAENLIKYLTNTYIE
jgi:hypothetical protein